jgi:hypothetical protein
VMNIVSARVENDETEGIPLSRSKSFITRDCLLAAVVSTRFVAGLRHMINLLFLHLA